MLKKKLQWRLLLILILIIGSAKLNYHVFANEVEDIRYKLDRVIEVKGRQGVAVDQNYYYVSGSKALYKYSKQGELLLANENPFKNFAAEVNHIGDIDVYRGEIYAGVEYFVDGQGKNIQIAIYDTKTLIYKRSMNYEPASGQVEVSGLTVDYDRGMVWMTDWVKGNYLYFYDLKSGQYAGKKHLQPVPEYQQGIAYHQGYLYITADDGNADQMEADHMYKLKVDYQSASQVKLAKTFMEVKRLGEIEGLSFDRTNNELIVHFNRGKQIILGMPRGLYPGYDKEIHELYIYKNIN